MSDRELADLTGLRGDALNLARQRDFSETIEVSMNEPAHREFVLELERVGLQGKSGGHLITVTSANADKGRATQWLINCFRKWKTDCVSIGLGDSPNDVEMLKVVDIAFQVKRPDGTWQELAVPNIRRVGIGPEGWREAIEQIAQQYDV